MYPSQRDHDDEEPQDHNSVWTSYSDLLLGVAIVFLVLFVYAMLNAGISQLVSETEIKKQEDLISNLVPEALRQENEKNRSAVENDIKEVDEKTKSIEESIQELVQLRKAMELRKNSLNNVFDDNIKKTGSLEKARLDLNAKSEEIKNLTREQEDILKSLAQREEEVKKSQKRIQNLEKNLQTKIDEIENEKASNAAYTEKVSSLEENIKKLKKENKAKEAVLLQNSAASSSLEKDLQAAKEQAAVLARQLKEAKNKSQTQSEDIQGKEHVLQSLRAELEKREGTAKGLGADKKSLQERIAGLQGQLGSALKGLKNAEGTIADLEGKLRAGDANARGLANEKGKLMGRIGGLEKELGDALASGKGKDGALGALQNQLGNSDRNVRNLTKDKANLLDRTKDLEKQLAKAKDADKASKTQLARQDREIKDAQKVVVDCQKEIASLREKEKTNRGKLEEKNKQNEGLEKQLAGADGKLKSAAKSLQKLMGEREAIARNLSNNLRDKGIDVNIDPTSGKITLRMDDTFYFSNNSFEIADAAKAKIKSLIPVYANSLFKDPKIRKRISAVTVTGFASPYYQGAYVDPDVDNPDAFNHNLELSLNRAREIAEYTLGLAIGEYEFKPILRKLLKVSGKSYLDSIPLSKEERSSPKTKFLCGNYDCVKSRRVEINFILNEEGSVDKGLGAIETILH